MDNVAGEVKRILKEKYDINAQQIEASKESTNKNVYIVHCLKDKYVVKIYDNIKHTTSMIKLHKKLETLKLNTPRIITTIDGKEYEEILNNNFLVTYSFLEGKQICLHKETKKLDDRIIVLVAKALREFHKSTTKNEFNLLKLPFKDNEKRKSVLHFDLTRGNIFELSENQIGFIDFDDAKYGDSICDVAIFITNLFFSKTRGVDLKGMEKFINEYYGDEIDLKNKEIPLIKDYALCWINYILDGNEFDASTKESFEVRKKLINDNL